LSQGCVSSGARHKSSPIDIGGLCFGEMAADFRIDRTELKESASCIGGQVSCACYRQWNTMEYMSCSGLLSFDPRGGCLRQMWLVVVMVMVSRGTEKKKPIWESLIFVVSGSSIDMEAEPR
ncbi:hypothetical protein LB506_006054, partial [Fusarium annulatum]